MGPGSADSSLQQSCPTLLRMLARRPSSAISTQEHSAHLCLACLGLRLLTCMTAKAISTSSTAWRWLRSLTPTADLAASLVRGDSACTDRSALLISLQVLTKLACGKLTASCAADNTEPTRWQPSCSN